MQTRLITKVIDNSYSTSERITSKDASMHSDRALIAAHCDSLLRYPLLSTARALEITFYDPPKPAPVRLDRMEETNESFVARYRRVLLERLEESVEEVDTEEGEEVE